jgi:hypothetical protein
MGIHCEMIQIPASSVAFSFLTHLISGHVSASSMPPVCLRPCVASISRILDNIIGSLLHGNALGAAHDENEKKKRRQQKLRELRSRRIIEGSQLHDVQCRLPPLLLSIREQRTTPLGKYEEERGKRFERVWRGATYL